MNTKMFAALLSTVALLSADAALACGGGHGVGHSYTATRSQPSEKPRLVKAVTKPEAQSQAPAPSVTADPSPVAPSLAAGIVDTNL